jgi:hypothetical protein
LQMPAEIVPPAPKPQAKPGTPADWMAAWDDLWKRRDDGAVLAQLEGIIQEHVAEDPNGFETARREAELVAWEADGEPDGSNDKAAKGKTAWEAGDRAIQANPGDVRGHYFSGVGVGLYSEGVGIFKLPWPKRDLDESIRVLRIAVRAHPANPRAKLYLADALIVNGLEGQDDEAHKLVQQILDAPGGRDPPEEKRVKEMARRWKSRH